MKTSTIAIIAISVGVAGGLAYFVAAQAFKPAVVAYNLEPVAQLNFSKSAKQIIPVSEPDDDLAQQVRNDWVEYQMSK